MSTEGNLITAATLLVILLTSSLSVANPPLASAPETLQVGRPLPRAALLTPGVHRYARYMISDDSRKLLDLWSRRVTYEDVDGRRLLRVHQRWDAADKSYVAIFDQTFEANTLRPLSQTQSVTRKDSSRTLSVRIDGSGVDSMSDGAPGSAKPLHKKFKLPFYNFHTDMELLQTLQLKKNYVVSIPFYDVGQDPPAYYTYSVAGEETLPAGDGTPIECWLVLAQFDPKSAPTRFWFAKRNQVLLREEVDIPGQGMLVKTLLNAEAEDSAG
jgi:hypothetical protein